MSYLLLNTFMGALAGSGTATLSLATAGTAFTTNYKPPSASARRYGRVAVVPRP